MSKTLALPLLCLAALSGCSLVRDLVEKSGKALGPAPEIVVPPSLLDGPAARLQDSLRPRLAWLASHPPAGWSASLIAFQNDSDTARAPHLLVETTERTPLNSHRRAPRDVALEETRRVLALAPWRRQAIESKLDHPLAVRVLYRHRDFLRSSSPFVQDTVTVRYSDSVATWKGAPLDPRVPDGNDQASRTAEP